jgi:outer membrane protein TolC
VKLNSSNANVGLNALDLKNLWKGSSLQYVLGPSLSIPIFDGGRLKSTLQLREIQQQEAAITYHKTVLQAWHEVVNALVAYRTEQQRRARLKDQVEHSRQALALSRTRYDAGVIDFITVLVAAQTYLQAELQHAQSTTNVSTNLVQLYKALGGGWEQTFPEEPAIGDVNLQSVQ